MYRKTVFKRGFKQVLCKYINDHQICFDKDKKNKPLKALKIQLIQHEFLAFIVFFETNQILKLKFTIKM